MAEEKQPNKLIGHKVGDTEVSSTVDSKLSKILYEQQKTLASNQTKSVALMKDYPYFNLL